MVRFHFISKKESKHNTVDPCFCTVLTIYFFQERLKLLAVSLNLVHCGQFIGANVLKKKLNRKWVCFRFSHCLCVLFDIHWL